MAEPEDLTLEFSVTSMIEEVLNEHGPQLSDVHTTSKSDTKIALKRNEATRWLRKSVGVVAAKDLPAEPSEQNFRMGLRSGLILCSALNKNEPGSIPKLVGVPSDSVVIPDGPPLISSPYYENIRNFLLAMEERGLPTFEASDLEQGGRLPKVVNCVLALKAYSEWKKAGANGRFLYVGNRKPSSKRKQTVCNSLDMYTCDTLWMQVKDQFDNQVSDSYCICKPLNVRVRDLLLDFKPRDIPMIIELVLTKLTEDFEHRLAKHKEKIKVHTIDNEQRLDAKMNPKPTKPDLSVKKSLPEDVKSSPRNIFHEMEQKSLAAFKKDEFVKPFTNVTNNDKEENTTTEAKGKEEGKSFSSIMNEMRKKASGDIVKPSIDTNKKSEKNVTTDTMKSTSDIDSKTEKNITADTMKLTGDINNKIEKDPSSTTDTMNSTSDVNKEIKNQVTSATDTMKSTSDVNKEIKKKVTSTTDAMRSASDVNKNMEEKVTKEARMSTSEDVKNEMEDVSDDVDVEIKEEEAIDSFSEDEDEDDEMEEDIDINSIIADVDNNEMEEDTTMEDDSEEEEEEDEATAEAEDLNGDIYGELEKKKKMEKKIELKKKEIERLIELEKKKEMERDAEMEKKREIKRQKEMERKKVLEKQAAEDEKEAKYYKWVNDECERLKLSIAKQQRMIEHQHKELQALKNIFSTAKADMQLLTTNYYEEVNNLGKHLLNLAQAASGYRKVVDENRKLYNQVQDLKGSIRVYCRVRPAFGTVKKPSCCDCIDEGNMAVITPGKGGKDTRKLFNFNRVFGPSATQALVYVDTQPLIRSVLDGYNVCIFAYGQTGSGKTFTMTGPDVFNEETMGVNYRSLNDLFDIQQKRKDMIAYEVCVQMLEIYNEMVRDLLSTDEIRLGTQDGINVPDAALIPVSKTDDVIRLMNLGHKNRAVGSTAMNQRSSRSHSCLTVHVSGKDLTSGSTVRGCMHLVDLAGSERADKTEATGDRLKEATFINKSLSALGDVIASLAQKSTHVPYRNSKLTLLLQDALGGQAKTLMFIHVSPDPDTVGETISTLKFAERVSTVELGAAKSNKDDTDLRQLKEQVAFLKAALAKDGGNIQDGGNIEEGDGGDDDDDGAASECSDAADAQPQKVANGGAKKPSQPQGKQTKASPAATPAKKATAPATKGKAAETKKKVGK
ncbi:hypothetical protein SSX86_009401 [Deinandra increscens subsp. villosa]|uniref:Uncharacterized protein n=1 Tax=Deinandra increscens subsp. villosa TaxID=3103831 RepID=A0AAP0DD80_9ASTR